jgi:hypothetical protein
MSVDTRDGLTQIPSVRSERYMAKQVLRSVSASKRRRSSSHRLVSFGGGTYLRPLPRTKRALSTRSLPSTLRSWRGVVLKILEIRMQPLPSVVTSAFKPASTLEICTWSFGAIHSPRPKKSLDWRTKKSTLDDEAIFGPLFDHRCACGKFTNEDSLIFVCDVCQTPIILSSSRRVRFGHINLGQAIPHVLCGEKAVIEAFPVLPAATRDSLDGSSLNPLYEDMIDAVQRHDEGGLIQAYERIVDRLAGILEAVVRWNLEDAPLLAKGIGLISKNAQSM